MDLICYVSRDWEPRIRPAVARRDWMDGTPEAYANRCLPLNIANSYGWEILSPVSFSAVWRGGDEAGSLEIDLSEVKRDAYVPISLFGSGVLTFHIEALFKTPPGWGLWVTGPANALKDGIAPLSGLVETDWSPYTFTMNWKLTRPDHPIRFEEDEPMCQIFPVNYAGIEKFEPRMAQLSESPELEKEFGAWADSRLAFHREMERSSPPNPGDRWQKLYYRGVTPDDQPASCPHKVKLRIKPFSGQKNRP